MTHPEYIFKFSLGKEKKPKTHYYSINLEFATMQFDGDFGAVKKCLIKQTQMNIANMYTF